MPPRLFTLEEATALLPTLRDLVSEVQARKRDLDRLAEALESAIDVSAGNGHASGADMASTRAATEEAARRLEALMGRIDELGCELKGIEEGLVDFRCEREGRVVYLCWRLGEERIAYWHDLDAGFGGRQPL